MLRFACPKLKALAATMQNRYDIRNKLILRSNADTDLQNVERDLIRIHKLIARHQRTCVQCKPFANRARIAPSNVRQLPGARPFISFDMAG